jgi:hypothetical protein
MTARRQKLLFDQMAAVVLGIMDICSISRKNPYFLGTIRENAIANFYILSMNALSYSLSLLEDFLKKLELCNELFL